MVFYMDCDPPCDIANRDTLYETVAAICRHALAAHAYVSIKEIRNGRRSGEPAGLRHFVGTSTSSPSIFRNNNAPWLSILKAACDKSHHAAWGISIQKRNAEYLAVLCNTIASAAHAYDMGPTSEPCQATSQEA